MKDGLHRIGWCVASCALGAGFFLQHKTQALDTQTQALQQQFQVMQRERDAQLRTSTSHITAETECTQRGFAPQVSIEGKKRVIRFSGSPANAVMECIAAISRSATERVGNVALVFPAPGIASGTIETQAP
jgi:hypothetical protein